MLKEELFKELTVDNIEFNGDVDMTEKGLVWSLKFEAPELEDDEEGIDEQEELFEALEEDFDFIKKLFKEYKEDINILEVDEIFVENDFMFVELLLEDVE